MRRRHPGAFVQPGRARQFARRFDYRRDEAALWDLGRLSLRRPEADAPPLVWLAEGGRADTLGVRPEDILLLYR